MLDNNKGNTYFASLIDICPRWLALAVDCASLEIIEMTGDANPSLFPGLYNTAMMKVLVATSNLLWQVIHSTDSRWGWNKPEW